MAYIDSKKEAVSDHNETDPLNEVRKPSASKFHQQKLPAWQPLLTAGVVFPLFFIVSAIFIPIGAYLYTLSESLHEVSVDYTNCRDSSNLYCMELVSKAHYYLNYRTCNCNVTLHLATNMTGQVYGYYGLTNFYQNHRRYVKSRDDSQLMGGQQSDLLADCAPYRTEPGSSNWYAPCGAIANSLFNDSFQLFYHSGSEGEVPVPWTSSGIAWVSDRERKFGQVANWNGTVKPRNWPLTAKQRSNSSSYRGDEELMVWMRASALPNFRKLHRIVQHSGNYTHELFTNGLPAGQYTLSIAYAYPVSAFSGTKSFILTTTAWTGGKNPAMGIMYMSAGCLHFLLGLLFAIVHVHASRNSVTSINDQASEDGSSVQTVSAAAIVTNDELIASQKAANNHTFKTAAISAAATANATAADRSRGGGGVVHHRGENTGAVAAASTAAVAPQAANGGHAHADAPAAAAAQPARPRNMLQSLTLADY